MPMQKEIYRIDALFLVTSLLYKKFICFCFLLVLCLWRSFPFCLPYADIVFVVIYFSFSRILLFLFLFLTNFHFYRTFCVMCWELYDWRSKFNSVCLCVFSFCYSVKILKSRIKHKDEKSFSISLYWCQLNI